MYVCLRMCIKICNNSKNSFLLSKKFSNFSHLPRIKYLYGLGDSLLWSMYWHKYWLPFGMSDFCLFIKPYGAICAFYEILIDWMENRQGMDNHQHAHVHAHHTITPKSTKRTWKAYKSYIGSRYGFGGYFLYLSLKCLDSKRFD